MYRAAVKKYFHDLPMIQAQQPAVAGTEEATGTEEAVAEEAGRYDPRDSEQKGGSHRPHELPVTGSFARR